MTDTAFVAPGIRARLERGWQPQQNAAERHGAAESRPGDLPPGQLKSL